MKLQVIDFLNLEVGSNPFGDNGAFGNVGAASSNDDMFGAGVTGNGAIGAQSSISGYGDMNGE
jgi:hypothetical protein